MMYRRPLLEDFPRIVELQNRNLYSALSEAERADGFLLTEFSLEQFQAMDRSVGVIVGVEDDKLCGYICSSSPEVCRGLPRFGAVLDYCAKLTYRGRPLGSYRHYFANPLCIEKSNRRRGLYSGLCNELIKATAGHYELGISVVSNANQRHLDILRKRNLEFVGEFETGEFVFKILVVPLRIGAKLTDFRNIEAITGTEIFANRE